MKTKDSMQIKVQTLPNGYSLDVNGVGFMYHSVVDLLAGFMEHVGLGETNAMDKGTILSSLMSAMLGEAYNDAVTLLKQRIGLLSNQYATTIDRMDKSIEFVNLAEKTISNLVSRIEAVETEMRSAEHQHAQNKKGAEELRLKIVTLEHRQADLSEQLADSATIMKAMDDAGKAIAGNKKKGTSKKKDDAEAKKIEQKAKTNPNIK